MLDRLIHILAKFFRSLPDFRGKYRISSKLHEIVIKYNLCVNTIVWVKMKDDFDILIDIKSQTHASAFWRGMYDTVLVNKFSALFKEDWVVIDVGANIGYYTIPFAKKLALKKGFVHVFEPLSNNYKHLNLSLERNQCTNYQTYQLGLGAKFEKIGISKREKGFTANAVILKKSLKTKLQYEESEQIEVFPFDDFVNENRLHRCDFIKLDIEGYEIDFLHGARDTIIKYRPIIYGEFSNYYIKQFDQEMEVVWQMCQKLSYAIYAPVKKRNQIVFIKVKEYRDKLEDILLIPTELSKEEINHWIN